MTPEETKIQEPSPELTRLQNACFAASNVLCKWRRVFAWWQLGKTRGGDGDVEFQAVADHRELTMLLRAEQNALLRLLVDKKVFTYEEYLAQLTDESTHLSNEYAKKFPGFRAGPIGLDVNVSIANDTMATWRP